MNNTNMKCRRCFFGYPLDGGEKCECHYEKPIYRGTFPHVRGCDWCRHFTDEETLHRPFEYAQTLGSPDTPDAATVRAC